MRDSRGGSRPGGLIGALGGLVVGGIILAVILSDSENQLAFMDCDSDGWSVSCERDAGTITLFLGVFVLVGAVIGAIVTWSRDRDGSGATGPYGSSSARPSTQPPRPSIGLSSKRPKAQDPQETNWKQALSTTDRIVMGLQGANLNDLLELSERRREYTTDLSEMVAEYNPIVRHGESQEERRRLAVQILSHPALRSLPEAAATLRNEQSHLRKVTEALKYLSEIRTTWIESSPAPIEHAEIRKQSDVVHIYQAKSVRFVRRLSHRSLADSAVNAGSGVVGISEVLSLLDSFDDLDLEVGRLVRELRVRRKSRLSADEIKLAKEFLSITNEIIQHDQLSECMSGLDDSSSLESRRESITSRHQRLQRLTISSYVASPDLVAALDKIDIESLAAPLRETISETTRELMNSDELRLINSLSEHESVSHLVDVAGLEIDVSTGLDELLNEFRMIDRRLGHSRSDDTTIDQERIGKIAKAQYVLAIRILNHQDLVRIIRATNEYRETESLPTEREKSDDVTVSRPFIELMEHVAECRSKVEEWSAPQDETRSDGSRGNDPLESGPIGVASRLAESTEFADELTKHDCAGLADRLGAFRRLMRQIEPIRKHEMLDYSHPLVQTAHEAATGVLGDAELTAIVDDIESRVKASTTRFGHGGLDADTIAREFLLKLAHEMDDYMASREKDVNSGGVQA